MIAELLISSGVMIALYITLWFFSSIILQRADVVDVAWGLVIAGIGMLALTVNREPSNLSLLITCLVTVWAMRLTMHIYWLNQKRSEDFRYGQLRQRWNGSFLLRSYVQVFLLQGILMLVVALPVIFLAGLSTSVLVPAWLVAGLLVWTIGFLCETLADAQLQKFTKRQQNKEKVMTTGLWRYSRHPNYFGEVLTWWGLWIILCASNIPILYKLLGILSPLSITYLILFVSGIPMLEKRYAHNKDYQAYAARTSRFVPLDERYAKI